MDYHSTVEKLFNHFYYKLYKNPNYKLDLSINNQRKQVDNFIKLVSNHYQLPSVDTNFLIDYFCFCFAYWSTKTTKRKISLNWIIGKKIFTKWLERTDSYQYFYRKFLREYDISVDNLNDQLHEQIVTQGLDGAEELEKKKFDGDARLFNCLMHTTLYNHKSSICATCHNKGACKDLLRQQFPTVFKTRGYDK